MLRYFLVPLTLVPFFLVGCSNPNQQAANAPAVVIATPASTNSGGVSTNGATSNADTKVKPTEEETAYAQHFVRVMNLVVKADQCLDNKAIPFKERVADCLEMVQNAKSVLVSNLNIPARFLSAHNHLSGSLDKEIEAFEIMLSGVNIDRAMPIYEESGELRSRALTEMKAEADKID